MITIFQVAAWLDQFGFDSYLLGLTYVPTNSYSMCMRICTDAQMHARTHARMHACTHARMRTYFALCTLAWLHCRRAVRINGNCWDGVYRVMAPFLLRLACCVINKMVRRKLICCLGAYEFWHWSDILSIRRSTRMPGPSHIMLYPHACLAHATIMHPSTTRAAPRRATQRRATAQRDTVHW